MTTLKNKHNKLKDFFVHLWNGISFAFGRDTNNIIKMALEKGDINIYRYSIKNKRLDKLVGNRFKKADFELDYFGKLIYKKDKKRYDFLLNKIIEGKMTKTTVQYLMLDTKSEKYKYKEITYDSLKEKDSNSNSIYIAIRDKSNEINYKHDLDINNRWMEMITQATETTVWNFNTLESKFSYGNMGFYYEGRPTFISDLINNTHSDDRYLIKSLADLFKKRRNQAFNIEVRVDVTEGKGVWNTIVIYGLPIEIDENGDVNVYSGYMMNITEKVSIEKELESATSIALKSEEMKKQFIANISHYIRTPLNSIMGFGQIIGQCTSDEERQMCLETMNQNNEDLLKYINDLLEYSSISAGYFQLKKETFDVCDILYSAKSLLENKRTDNITEVITKSPTDIFIIEWDKDEMNKLFIYLVNNALKSSKEGNITLGFYGTTEGIEIYCIFTGDENLSETFNDKTDCFSKPDFNDSLNSLELRLCKLISEKANGQTTIKIDNKNLINISIHIPCAILDVGNNDTK